MSESRPKPVLVDEIGSRQASSRPLIKRQTAVRNSTASPAFEAEQRAFELMNAERQAKGLRMLEWDDELADVARFHARNMAENKFFSHRGLDGATVDQRAAQKGVKWIGIGENIAALRGHSDPGSFAVETWMNSGSHKKNILSGQWQTSGIGAVTGDDGTVYFVQVFIFK
jgi:uncharacterized protein YkwD